MNQNPLSFTLNRAELPVTIDGKEYKLIEMDGQQRDAYVNEMAGRIRKGADGKANQLSNYGGIAQKLLALSLFDVTEGKYVTESTLNKWPAKVLNALADEARKLSGLDKEDAGEREEAAKNG